MKVTITYQEDSTIKSKVVYIEHMADLEDQLNQFDNIIKIKKHTKENKRSFLRNRKKEMLFFFKQLDLMLQSHMSFNEALELILETNLDTETKNLILALQNAVIQNYPIDTALNNYKKYIGETPLSFLKQGLENGTIKSSVHSIVVLLEKELEIVTSLSEKLRYPLFLILSLFTSISTIFIYVVPSFEFIFNSLGETLPLSTKILLSVNQFFTNYWFLVLIIGASFIFIVLFYIQIYRFMFDKLLFTTLPLVSSVVRSYQLYKLFLSLYISVESKYQFQVAIMNSIGTISNLYLKDILQQIEVGIKNGENIAELFDRFNIFDPMVIKLLHAAQNTGQYEIVLLDISKYYQENFELKLKKFTSVIEPLIISIIALIVLWLILAIMVPIWQLSAVGL